MSIKAIEREDGCPAHLFRKRQMTPYMYTTDELVANHSIIKTHSPKEQIHVQCSSCQTVFTRTRKVLDDRLRQVPDSMHCTLSCKNLDKGQAFIIQCVECGNTTRRTESQLNTRLDKHGNCNQFCSRSCSVTHQNKNKTTGHRRSKLEIMVEDHIIENYPKLEFICNDSSLIGLELDFYFPDLKLGIELNGIFHYQPIFGEEKLQSTIKNDQLKIEKCKQFGIQLVQVDTSTQKTVNNKTSKPYVQKISDVIHSYLSKLSTDDLNMINTRTNVYRSNTSSRLSAKQQKLNAQKQLANELANQKHQEMVSYYTSLYDRVCEVGYGKAMDEFNYTKSKPNMVVQFKRYVEKYAPQNGKTRGK